MAVNANLDPKKEIIPIENNVKLHSQNTDLKTIKLGDKLLKQKRNNQTNFVVGHLTKGNQSQNELILTTKIIYDLYLKSKQ